MTAVASQTVIILMILACLACFTGRAWSAPESRKQFDWYTRLQAFAHSETAPVKQIVADDFVGDSFDGGERSFTHNLWETGVIFRNFRFAYLLRYDYDVKYDPDTVFIIYADKNSLPVEAEREYDVRLQALHTQSQGFKFGYQHQPSENFVLSADISYLVARKVTDGELTGNLTVDDNNQYSGGLSLDYIYDTDRLLGRNAEKPEGQGYSMDFGWRWAFNETWSVEGLLTDFFSKIYFNEAPYTLADASSDRISLDENGRIDVKPVLSGFEGYQDYVFRYPRQFSLRISHDYQSNIMLSARWKRYDDYDFLFLENKYQLNDDLGFSMSLEPRSRALSLGIHSDYIQFELTSDRVDFSKARTFGLVLGLSIKL